MHTVHLLFCSISSYYFEIQHFNNIALKYEPIKCHLTSKKTGNSMNCVTSVDFCLLLMSSGHVWVLLRYLFYTLDAFPSQFLESHTWAWDLGEGSTQLSPPFSRFSVCSVLPSDLESPGTASLPLRVQNSWRRSQFFSLSGKMHTG